jgi:hypothetical protein
MPSIGQRRRCTVRDCGTIAVARVVAVVVVVVVLAMANRQSTTCETTWARVCIAWYYTL